MPYSSTSELPESVRNALPSHAQIIYKVAFNHAYSEYQNPEDRRGHEDRETVAHKVAWSAVKKKYEKADDGKWHAKK